MEANPQPPKKEKEPLPLPAENETDPQDLIDLERASWEGMIEREKPKPPNQNVEASESI